MTTVAKEAFKNKKSDLCGYDKPPGTKYWISDPQGEALLQQSATGLANYEEGVPLRTTPEILELAAEKSGDKPALRTEGVYSLGADGKATPAKPLDDWKTWTYGQYLDDVKSVAKAFIDLGLQQHQSVNIYGFNAPEWNISFYGAIFAGGKAAGIYPSDTAEQVRYKSDHSDAVIAVCQNESSMAKFVKVAEKLPLLKVIVTYQCDPGDDIQLQDRTIKRIRFEDLLAHGKDIDDSVLDQRRKLIKPGHPACLIYTSGTTGKPKAVMLSHDNLNYASYVVIRATRAGIGEADGEAKIVSYLPLSHVAGMLIDILVPVAKSSHLVGFNGWCSTNYARPYDLKKGSLVDRLKAVRPTIFLGVPRVYEKIMEKLKKVGENAGSVQKAVSDFAKSRALTYVLSRQLGGSGETPSFMWLSNFILGIVKKKLGLDKCEYFVSGAAPLSVDVANYFASLGISINEAYAMSESTSCITWSSEEFHSVGSCGFELPGVEVKILDRENKPVSESESVFVAKEESQGELCFRGRTLMMGYMANPRLGKEHVNEINQKNADAIDSNGFLHSGDKGTKDKKGLHKITGRYKEIIVTAGGENISPIPIEDELKKLCPLISNALMIGNKRKFNVILLTLKARGATGESPGTDELADEAAKFSTSSTVSEAIKDEKFAKEIENAIKEVNKKEEVVVSNAAKIQKFTILPHDFSVETEELTATLKLKRAFVEGKYEKMIDKMYVSKSSYVPFETS
eukprot:maker-scaffold_1-snap-gene-19.26-mRNA-1 protein AED:0.01 eAED:0.01 QI:133/1/1/1/1/1/2/168/737